MGTVSDTSRGLFITFEGGEGAGKSSHITALAKFLESQSYKVLLVREPGGGIIGEAIRSILLNPNHDELVSRAELFLYEAARAQIVESTIRPALESGTVVLCDRFYDSTTAYQGYARGLDLDMITQLNSMATAGLVPDRTIVLDLPAEEGLRRATANSAPDRLESEASAFHEAVRSGFLSIAAAEPNRIRVVDASLGVIDVWQNVHDSVADLFGFELIVRGDA